jgi:hypothetical protein
MRESPSFFAFPLMLSLHAIGMALAAGINAALALRLLGAARAIDVPDLQRFFPAMWLGFWMNASSGIVLLIAYPTKGLTNPVFYVKLALIATAMICSRVLTDRAFAAGADDRAPLERRLAIASLVCWSMAIVAGRLLAYTYTHILAGM